MRFLRLISTLAILLICAGACLAAADSLTLSLEAPSLDKPSSPQASSESAPAPDTKREANTVRVGKVGLVAANSAVIYKTKSGNAPKYATVKIETPLAIIKDEGDWYGILMANGATGWISKHLVKLTGYELMADKTSDRRGSFTSRSGDSVPRQGIASDGLIRTALGYSGVRYVFGGANPSTGMDCSAFVRMIFGEYGVSLPRTAREQAQVGTSVSLDQLQPGDRLYFQCKNSYVDHCGIYAGNGYFVHCSATHRGVAVDSLSSDFYWRSLVAARRS